MKRPMPTILFVRPILNVYCPMSNFQRRLSSPVSVGIDTILMTRGCTLADRSNQGGRHEQCMQAKTLEVHESITHSLDLSIYTSGYNLPIIQTNYLLHTMSMNLDRFFQYSVSLSFLKLPLLREHLVIIGQSQRSRNRRLARA